MGHQEAWPAIRKSLPDLQASCGNGLAFEVMGSVHHRDARASSPPAFTPGDFVKHTVLGCSVRRHYRLLSKSQFLAKYGVDPGVVNAPVDTGAEIHDILVEAGQTGRWR